MTLRYPGAAWAGPVPNESPGGMALPPWFVVAHIEQGTEAGTDAWFHNPAAQASAHLGIDVDGTVQQFVDLDVMAWAEVNGNPRAWSVEHAGVSGQPLTPPQLLALAQFLAWASRTAGVPLQLAPLPLSTSWQGAGGLTWHSAGGLAWGGHLDCPGPPVVRQLPQVVTMARLILTPPTTTGGDVIVWTNPDKGGGVVYDAGRWRRISPQEWTVLGNTAAVVVERNPTAYAAACALADAAAG